MNTWAPTAIVELLGRHKFRYVSESELHEGIAQVLEVAGVVFEREKHLGSIRDRIDFFTDGIGIEVKVGGALSSCTRQLHRYSQRPEIAALVLVTSLARLDRQPAEMNGKPVHVCVLRGTF